MKMYFWLTEEKGKKVLVFEMCKGCIGWVGNYCVKIAYLLILWEREIPGGDSSENTLHVCGVQ